MREKLRGGLLGLTVLVALGVLLGTTASAQDRRPSLPDDCWSGEIVVSSGHGEFECRSLLETLRLSGCRDGDFVTTDGSGALECERPSTWSSGARGLLPECSSGQTLVSEGFGRWACADRP